ncbi:hypothetical protein G8D20_12315 [Xanthomonas vesicatoria]|nr:hypothetical protein [Xanthomonas vesicatoria]
MSEAAALIDKHFLLPESTRELAEIIGLDNALALGGLVPARHSGGNRGRHASIYVSTKPKGAGFERISAVIGDEAAKKVTTTFGGTHLRVNVCKVFADQVRDSSVRDYWHNSTLGAAWIAWLHAISERQVRNITSGEPRPAFDAAGRPPSKNNPTL